MSNDAGDSSSRLSDALDDIFSKGDDDRAEPAASGEPASYELPEIVPATEEAPSLPERPEPTAEAPAIDPALPARSTAAPAPAPAPAAPATTTPPSAQSSPTSPSSPIPPTTPTTPTTSWGDHMPAATAATVTTPAASQLRAPGRRPRVRRVTRVLRHIDPWSTFKIALLFSAVAYVVSLTSGVLLWRVADATGTLANVERWFTQFGWETFELKGGEIFHQAWIIGLFGVVFATGAAVLLVTLFNLVSDIVGGVRMTVLEEEVVERTISSTRRYVVRNPSADAAAQRSAPAWSVDDDATSTGSTEPTPDAGSTAPAGDEPTRPMPTTNGNGSADSGDGQSSERPAATWSVD